MVKVFDFTHNVRKVEDPPVRRMDLRFHTFIRRTVDPLPLSPRTTLLHEFPYYVSFRIFS